MKLILAILVMSSLAFAEAKLYTASSVQEAHETMCNFYDEMMSKHQGTYLSVDSKETKQKSLEGVQYYKDLYDRMGCGSEFAPYKK